MPNKAQIFLGIGKYIILIIFTWFVLSLVDYKYGARKDWFKKTARCLNLQIKELDIKILPEITGVIRDGTICLGIQDSFFKDLYELDYMPVRVLILKGTQVKKLSYFKRNSILRVLQIDGAPLVDITPLSSVDNLKNLELRNTQVSDLSPLRNIQLKYLDVSGSPVTDISDVNTSDLISLSIAETGVTNLATLNPEKLLEFNFSENNMPDNEIGLGIVRKMTNCNINTLPYDQFWKRYNENHKN